MTSLQSLEEIGSSGILAPKARALYLGMKGFEAPYLQEKLKRSGEITDPGIYDLSFGEFKKYAALSVSSSCALGMTSPEVDTLWHQFILFTPKYQGFCENNLGKFLHHNPFSSNTGFSKVQEHANNMKFAYEATFGNAPSIWRGFQASADPCDGCSASDQ